MKYLLDTCVISEMIRPVPNHQVIAWITDRREEQLALSVLTIGELYKGIFKLPDSKRKTDIRLWMRNDLQRRFGDRILDISKGISEVWGEIQGNAEKQGKKMPAIDSLLAATAIFHRLTLVTRNISDVEVCEVPLLNPWKLS